jgi:hypothetical protein
MFTLNDEGRTIIWKCTEVVTTTKKDKRKGNQHVSGKHMLSQLWKIEIWKMETGEVHYSGN